MNIPVIYLSFANDATAPLPCLLEEEHNITNACLPLQKQGLIQLQNTSHLNVEMLFNTLSSLRNQILIFHYGGHANREHLFTNGDKIHALGIARILAQQKNLELVFLNGCSTQAQVNLLLKLGVKSVIATSTTVGDRSASVFASQFYNSLTNQASIQQAFNEATAKLEAQQLVQARKIKIHRMASISQLDDIEEHPWGLYTLQDTHLEWNVKQLSLIQQQGVDKLTHQDLEETKDLWIYKLNLLKKQEALCFHETEMPKIKSSIEHATLKIQEINKQLAPHSVDDKEISIDVTIPRKVKVVGDFTSQEAQQIIEKTKKRNPKIVNSSMSDAVIHLHTIDYRVADKFLIVYQQLCIGRHSTSDVCINDPYISGKHARLYKEGNQWYVIDTSTNGTFINEVQVARNERHVLPENCNIRFDYVEFNLKIISQPL